MAMERLQSQPAYPAEEHAPKDPGLPADYLRWISFEGCCSVSAEPAGKRKLPVEPEAERERAREAHSKTQQGSE